MNYNVGITLDITDVSTDTDSAYGLDSGVFYWVTGRPGYAPGGYSGDAPASKTWKEGFLLGLSKIKPSTHIIDIDISGDYATLSGFSFSVRNNGQFHIDADTNEWWVLGKKVNVYLFLSDVSYFSWSGVVTDVAPDEKEYKVTCRDVSESVHKNMPPRSITAEAFPHADDSVIGDPIPISFGFVNRAKCLTVFKQFDPIDIIRRNNNSYKVAPMYSFDGQNKYIYLNTGSLRVTADQYVGYIIKASVGSGASNQTATIVANTIPEYGLPVSTRHTRFTLANWFDSEPTGGTDGNCIFDSTGADGSSQTGDPDSPNIWYFEISQYENTGIVSQGELSEFYADDNGNNNDTAFITDDNIYRSMSAFVTDTSVDNINGVQYPGITYKTKGDKVTSALSDIVNIQAVKVETQSTFDGAANPNYTYGTQISTELNFGGDNPELYDRDYDTELDHVVQIEQVVPTSVYRIDYKIAFEVEIPSALIEEEYSEAYLLSDVTFTSSLDTICEVNVSVYGSDVNSRVTDPIVSNVNVFGSQTISGTVEQTIQLILRSYYGEFGPDTTFDTYKESLDISEYISDSNALKAYPKLVFEFNFICTNASSGTTLTANFKEFAFAAVKTIEYTNENAYTKLDGEMSPNAITTHTLDQIYAHILETYDGISSSDISYTDLALFNEFYGRQVLEVNNSKDYLTELCRQTFTGMFWNRGGELVLKSYYEDTTSVFAFDESEIIKDSIAYYKDTPIDKIFNDFMIEYDWDPGLDKFNKTIGITRTDESSFPAITDSTDTNTSRTANFTSIRVVAQNSDGLWDGTLTYSADQSSWAEVNKTISWSDASGNVIYFARIKNVSSDGLTLDLEFTNTGGVMVGLYTTASYLYENGTSIQKWKTFAIGISDYATANELWTKCRTAYLRTKRVNTLPDQYSKLYWHPDNNNFPGYSGGMGDAAFTHLTRLIDRVTVPGKHTEFQIPITAANMARELLDRVTFSDTFYTNGTALPGWINKIKMNYDKQTMTIGLYLLPIGYEQDYLIIETGSGGDIIVETGSGADLVREGQ